MVNLHLDNLRLGTLLASQLPTNNQQLVHYNMDKYCHLLL